MVPAEDAPAWRGKIDVMILCGGSATDLPEQGPYYASSFNTVDSFDTHARIPEYFESMDRAAKKGGNLALISCGWDPGLFSLMRVLGGSTLPSGKDYTFWGKGVSQGHSDAIRRVPGVKLGTQYTIPREEALTRVRAGENPELRTAEKHLRECFVVAEAGADKTAIENAIKTMPNYFADYETTVNFISEAEFVQNHARMPHGGFVLRTGSTTPGTKAAIEFSLKLDSNPEFTASVLVAYARAIHRMAAGGQTGAVTVFDVPFGLLSPKDPAALRGEML